MISILTVVEADAITGPAHNVLEFQRTAARAHALRLRIATFHRDGVAPTASHSFVTAARADGIPVYMIRERYRFDMRVIAGLRRVVSQCRPDIIETHHVKSHCLLRLSGLWRHYPWVAYHHGYTRTDLKMQAYNQFDRWSLRYASRIVTVCRAFALDIESIGVPAARIRVLHNAVPESAPVDRERGRALRAHLGIHDDEQVLLAVGRLSREKGHLDLIQATHRLKKMRPERKFKAVIIGDGPEGPALKRAIAASGLNECVLCLGQVSDVAPYYELADVFVLPSHSEGSPLVLLEAMAAGVPVVATAVGGVPEIAAHDESCRLVSPHNPLALASAIALLLDDVPLAHRLATNALEVVADSHTPEVHCSARLAIYRELLENPTRRPSSLLNLFKTIVFSIYLYSGYVPARDFVLGLLGRARVVVVYLHRIGASDPMTRPAEAFRRDLSYFRRQYECIGLFELCERLRDKRPFRRGSVVITFDDGYRDNYTEAVPLLIEAGVPATFFVSTGFVGTQREFPHDAGISSGPHPKLTWDDLRAMQQAGFEIGSHTVEHTNLGQVDAEVTMCELMESRRAIDRELGQRPRAFSFPWGKPSDIPSGAVAAVQQAGYYAALSAYGGANNRDSGPFNLRRVDIGNGNLGHLAVRARVAGFDPDYFRWKRSPRAMRKHYDGRRHADL